MSLCITAFANDRNVSAEGSFNKFQLEDPRFGSGVSHFKHSACFDNPRGALTRKRCRSEKGTEGCSVEAARLRSPSAGVAFFVRSSSPRCRDPRGLSRSLRSTVPGWRSSFGHPLPAAGTLAVSRGRCGRPCRGGVLRSVILSPLPGPSRSLAVSRGLSRSLGVSRGRCGLSRSLAVSRGRCGRPLPTVAPGTLGLPSLGSTAFSQRQARRRGRLRSDN